MKQYYDLKFSGYIPGHSQLKYTYKSFENIASLLLLLKYPNNSNIPYFLHKAMYRTNLVISSLELVLIMINYTPQIERFNGYKNMYKLLTTFGFIMRNKAQCNKEAWNSN
jgi:hypothetical protein